MRIEAYTQVQQVYKAAKTGKSQKTAGTGSFADQLEISSAGKDFQTAKQAVANSPDIREAMTAPLKKSIQAGNYEVSGETFADKLMKKYEEMR